MHEMSIAQSIVEIILEEAQEEVKEVYFKASILHQILPDSLIFYYDILKNDHKNLRNSKLIVEPEMIIAKCKNCNKEYQIDNLLFLCEVCNSGVEIVQGKEMYIDKIII